MLRIRNAEQLINHPLRGAIFENFVVAECIKLLCNRGIQPPLYFWRDQHGHEIDLINDLGTKLTPVEIKSGATFQTDWLKNLEWFAKLQTNVDSFLVYGGDKKFVHSGVTILPWTSIEQIFPLE